MTAAGPGPEGRGTGATGPGTGADTDAGGSGGREVDSRPATIVRVRAAVTGRVQGVWYRQGCRREAERLGVAGWVANRPDGAVEIEAEGPRPAVEDLLAWARRGSARAVVERVVVEDLPPRGDAGFRVRG
jgi:acylphosphatase